MSYNRCTCQKCEKQFATVIDNELVLQQESCPNCGAKELKLNGPLSVSEVNSLFYSGG
jgi:Zn finger protein HypA/HybF involved in hydrogenase expression